MNSSSITFSIYQSGVIAASIAFPPISDGSMPFGATYKASTSFEMSPRITPTENSIIKGPTVLKPAAFPEDYDARAEAFRRFLDSLESEAETTDDVTSERKEPPAHS